MASSHILQIFLQVTVQNQICIAQRIVVDEVVQFRPLRHGHIQCILDPGAVDGNFSPIPEQQLHAAGVHVEFAGLVQHIQNYHEYYAKDENWKNFVLHNKGPKAWEQDKAEREMVLTEFIPYLKQHCNLSAMEQTATTALREGQNISPEQAAYYNAVV